MQVCIQDAFPHQIPDHMEGPDEPVWISNMRKAFVNIFRVPLLWVRQE